MSEGLDWKLLHADADLLVVEKPSGLLSVPGRGEAGVHNLASLVQAQFADALIVHRLDMGTSGLMLFPRGKAALRVLSLAFEQRRVHKAYVAVVEGWIEAERGVIDAPLIADWPRRPRQMVDPIHGKPALTRWRVLERRGDSATGLQTRVHLEPTTGRSHQLRVHLAHIGHPIVGDPFYGNSSVAPTGRLLLHASMLAFHHPATGEPMQFDSAAPF